MSPGDGLYQGLVEGLAEEQREEELGKQLNSIRAERCKLLDALLYYENSHQEVPFDVYAEAGKLQAEEDEVARELGVDGPMIDPLFFNCQGSA